MLVIPSLNCKHKDDKLARQCLTTIGFKGSQEYHVWWTQVLATHSCSLLDMHSAASSLTHCVRQPAQGKTNVSDVLQNTCLRRLMWSGCNPLTKVLNAVWHSTVKKKTCIKSTRQRRHAELHTAVKICRPYAIQ